MPVWPSSGPPREDKAIFKLKAPGAKFKALSLLGIFFLVGGGCLLPRTSWGAAPVEVRRLGLSRVGGNTLLTVVLDKPAKPRVTPRKVAGKPQLVVEFPQARAGRLPTHLEGDDLLVEQVTTETAPRGGVRIVLDLYPERPYAFWRQQRPGSSGQTIFMVGLKVDATARTPVRAQLAPPPESGRTPESPPGSWELEERGREPQAPEPGEDDYGYKEPQESVAPGSFAELGRLLPKAASLFQSLGADGWIVSETHRYDRPGTRLSRDFMLTNHKYPELVVKIAYLPANTPNTPNIGIIMLSTEKLQGETADKYRSLRQWSFAQIKKHYEDIGDFFDDALKPLRVKLREQTRAIALRDAAVLQNFLRRACPQEPQLAEKVMKLVDKKVSPRFEGVQYTVSENPLVILSLVDFLFVKVYYVDSR
jgi:hypothetical protein